jgi:hypothetical protein
MSEVKVNKLSPRSGTTVTLGDSGDTISIPSGVTLTSFTSTGIDDNATSTAITIDSSQNVSFAEDISTGNNGVLNILDGDGDISGKLANQSSSAHSLEIIADPSNSGANSNMIFKIDNTERMRIDSSGNVGIGVSSPQEVLHLKDGDIAVGNGTASNDAVIGRIGFSTDSSNSRFIGIESFRGSDAANADLRFHTFGGDSNSGERMRIDSSGNVGIGNTVASTINSANGTGNLVVGSGSGTEGITIYSGTTGEGTLQFADGTSGSAAYIGQINYNHSSNDMSFTSGGTERMRLLGTGSVGIGTTSPSTSYRLSAVGTTSGAVVGAFIETTSTNSSHEASIIKRPNNGVLVQFLGSGQVGSITTDGSSTTYGTSSDYRLKENVVDLTNATERLKQLKPARFNFIADADKIVDGFLAHEVSSIVPEAIHGTHNEVEVWKEGEELPEGVSVGDNKLDENGNTIPKYQNIDQSKLVPLLVKTIQELEARITTLEANNP